ncbi:MAG: chemotaxis protein CheD [Thermodesulfobacteriota bacterium]|nr:chemotaxis protein CheD [Thermodesulfobacteriota bacterium]
MKALCTTGVTKIYLKPEKVYWCGCPCSITTILGSCLSVTMYHPSTGMAAVCHAVLPKYRSSYNKGLSAFVDTSIAWMLDQFTSKRITKKEIEVKIFGGSAMFDQENQKGYTANVGSANIETARNCLEKSGIKIKAWDVGGNLGRKMIFDTATGDILIKKVEKTAIREASFG